MDTIFLNNRIFDYLVSFLLFLLFLTVFKIFQKIVLKKLESFSEKTETELDETLVEAIKKIKPSFYLFVSLYLAVKFLNIPSIAIQVLDGALIAFVVYQIIISLHIIIDYFIERHFIKEKDEGTKSAIINLGKIGKAFLWAFGILLVVSNFGINVTSLIAGLGIGGLAIAIAMQNILSDLFSSFVIHFDKPFTPGDFIIVGDYMGVVDKVGIKTTRIKALQGEEIVISNNELVQSRIQNFKKMKERRVVFNFGVEYGTPTKKLKSISKIVEELVNKEELVRLDRVHFTKFGESSLDFEVAYYILSGDYTEFMDAHQSILLQVKESLEKEKVSMAFPTRTVHLIK